MTPGLRPKSPPELVLRRVLRRPERTTRSRCVGQLVHPGTSRGRAPVSAGACHRGARAPLSPLGMYFRSWPLHLSLGVNSTEVEFHEAVVRETEFHEADVRETEFHEAVVRETEFHEAVVREAQRQPKDALKKITLIYLRSI